MNKDGATSHVLSEELKFERRSRRCGSFLRGLATEIDNRLKSQYFWYTELHLLGATAA